MAILWVNMKDYFSFSFINLPKYNWWFEANNVLREILYYALPKHNSKVRNTENT